MARNRRISRALADLPGLFDDIDLAFKARDPRAAEKPAGEEEEPLKAAPAQAPTRNLQFISFGSGSSGNSCYIGIQGEGGVIVDAGVEPDKVLMALSRNCIPTNKIAGIIITHDHSDHTRYAYSMLRKLPKMLLFCTPRTLHGILTRTSVSRRIKEYHKPIYKEFAFQAGPLTITPFEVSHDGCDNVGFCISAGSANFVVATDMGVITERASHYISLANHLMIEANYDAAMLAVGSYPEHLKARIRSATGHLDNTYTASFLAGMWKPCLTDIFLCHLSNDNNRPEIALAAVGSELRARGITVGDGSGSVESRDAQVQLSVLPRFECTPLRNFRI